MSSRSKTISKLLAERPSRESYIRSKLAQVIPSQIKALRLREDWTQKELGDEADMKQARISAMESPGEVNFTLQTLIRLAAALNVGLWVEFLSHAEMLRRENQFSQDNFRPTRLVEDVAFLSPATEERQEAMGNLVPMPHSRTMWGDSSDEFGEDVFMGARVIGNLAVSGDNTWLIQQ
jgi:transcriptional regulator with XRE-family HTH domain